MQLFIFKVVKDIGLLNSFDNDVKFEYTLIFKVVKDRGCPIHLIIMTTSSILIYLKKSKMRICSINLTIVSTFSTQLYYIVKDEQSSNLFDNNIKLKDSFTFKEVKDLKLPDSIRNIIKLKYDIINKYFTYFNTLQISKKAG